ncbi:MAG: hypothetical protein HYT89_06590 [Candidatus Omnitrophica bacterium]|nr:hypothetical protein [Candidatus Omnitrophota bacterium]
MPLNRVQEPFVFKSQMSLVEMTGRRAGDLAEFGLHLKEVPEASVYYHTHHFLQQHQFLVPEPPNDFAYWVASVLQEEELGERLAAIDTVQFHTLGELRGAITAAIDRHLEKQKTLRKAPPGEEFYFMKCILFTFPTTYVAYDLKEFLGCLERVSVGCLYNHIFEARLRPPLGMNDFSYWLRKSLDEEDLAKRIESLDPYTHTMDGLRKGIIRLIARRLGEESGG